MWQIDNRTPFAAAHGWVRDRNGAEIWLVAVKCTFDVREDGTTEVAKEQAPVLRVPEYHGEPGKSSLKFDADIVLTKTTTDVLVVGHAYAPGGRAVTRMEVGLRAGELRKVLTVTGDRYWGPLGITSPNPFLMLPLVYERAFGGVDPRSAHPERDWHWPNPVGTGFGTSRKNLEGTLLPNIEYPGEQMSGWRDRPRVAGFGPIGSHWQPRAMLAGTYDDQWMRNKLPLLPDDFDDRFFQSAPADQQTKQFLRGGEPFALEGLTRGGILRFHLPKVFLGFDTRFYDGSRQVHQYRKLHTVILEPDVPRLSMVWHSALPCHFKVQKLDRTIVTLKSRINGGESDDIRVSEA